MKLIIAGSRYFPNIPNIPIDIALIECLICLAKLNPARIVCGCAPGTDMLGFEWARQHNLPIDFFPAWDGQWTWARKQWRQGDTIHTPPQRGHFKGRGFVRNGFMAQFADSLLAIWDGMSHGTEDMIGHMQKSRKPFEVIDLSKPSIRQALAEHAGAKFSPGAIPGGRKDVPSLAVDSTATLVERNPPRPVGRAVSGT